ncbi:MAG: cyclic pyranopterin monophosphate synthase MoaC [Acidipila sp.]|nr:cyclic pyranopterin monophosphate synthase MoaC [Acidipila sp.]
MPGLSHYRKGGEVQMVDVSAKGFTERTVVARAFIRIGRAAMAAVRAQRTPKGNPLEIARIAGIAAAKRTAELIPLCHPLPLTYVDVAARLRHNGVELTARVSATARTGVEMEALTAVAVAALTVYDMCKALDKEMEISSICVLEKIGGKSGPYARADKRAPSAKRSRAGASRRVGTPRRGTRR